MNDLGQLERSLRQTLNPVLGLDQLAHADPCVLERLEAIRQAFTPLRGHRCQSRIAQGVMAFRLGGRQTPYPELKYACYGLARPMDWEGRILLTEPLLLDQLLAAVRAQRQHSRQFCACYRGLLTAWLVDVVHGNALGELSSGAVSLKGFLLDMRAELVHAPRRSRWAALVQESGLEHGSALLHALGVEK